MCRHPRSRNARQLGALQHHPPVCLLPQRHSVVEDHRGRRLVCTQKVGSLSRVGRTCGEAVRRRARRGCTCTTCWQRYRCAMRSGKICNAHIRGVARSPCTRAALVVAGAPPLPALKRRACRRGRGRWRSCGGGLCRRRLCRRRLCRCLLWQLAVLHQMAQLPLAILLAPCCRQLPQFVVVPAPESQGSQRVSGKQGGMSGGQWRRGGGPGGGTSARSRERCRRCIQARYSRRLT